ncbi:MAG: hypothetical protein SFZ23_06445 [Planctomycetota bacterium]|nr:hypothetical protein [Planctomycetota bacterium]
MRQRSAVLRGLIRWTCLLLALAVAAQAFILWDATGRRWFTRYRDPELENRLLTDVRQRATLEALGIPDADEQIPIENHFTLGALPVGFNREGISLLTLAGPMLVLSVVLAVSAPRRHPA